MESNSFQGLLQSISSDVLHFPAATTDQPAPVECSSSHGQAPSTAGAGCSAAEAQPLAAAVISAADAGEDGPEYAALLQGIKQRFGLESVAASDVQQYLQEAQQEARQRELAALAAADEAYTVNWRQAGLPVKPSMLQLDPARLAGSQLLDPTAIMAQHHTWVEKELQPPLVFNFTDKHADPHYLQTTANLQVRQQIASHRIAASRAHPQQQQQQQQQGHASRGSGIIACSSGHAQNSSTASRGVERRVPWSQLPPDELNQKLAAAAARHKAMAAVMTPEQCELEERIIKSMYHKLSFQRNPRHPLPPALAAQLQQGMRGTSKAHKRTQKQQQVAQGSANSGAAAGGGSGIAVFPAGGALFEAYEPGGLYCQTLQLQNVASTILSLRLLPPASRYFHISLPKFPSAANELAAGMAAEVAVCFCPDSLGDYEDCFVVDTVTGRLEVALRGCRPHPVLTLPAVLQVGDVLIGNSRTRTVRFLNKGGPGRFLVLPEQEWAAKAAGPAHQQAHQQQQQQEETASSTDGRCGDAPQATAAASAAVSGAFTVSPRFLELPARAAGELQVAFTPVQMGRHSSGFVLVCDNCTVQQLDLQGQGSSVQVELVEVDGRRVEEADTDAPLWFGQLPPGCSCMRTLKIHNSTQLAFPFRWQIDALLQPAETARQSAGELAAAAACQHAAAAAAGDSSDAAGLQTSSCGGMHSPELKQQDKLQMQQVEQQGRKLPDAFTVFPQSGVIQAGELLEFAATFAPPSTGGHAAAARLLLERSGDALNSLIDTASPGANTASSSSSSNSSLRRVKHGSAFSPRDAMLACRSDESEEGVVQLGFEGLGLPIALRAEPASGLLLPGRLIVGEAAQQVLVLHNDSAAPAHFCVLRANEAGHLAVGQGGRCSSAARDAHSSSRSSSSGGGCHPGSAVAAVSVLPRAGTVPPQSSLQLTVNFMALAAGIHTEKLLCQVAHGPAVPIEAQLVVAEAAVVPAQPQLDFGIICLGSHSTSSQLLHLVNSAGSCSTAWHLEQMQQQDCFPAMQLQLEPCMGLLSPAGSCTTRVTVTGSCEGSHKLLLCIRSASSSSSSSSSSISNGPSSSGHAKAESSCASDSKAAGGRQQQQQAVLQQLTQVRFVQVLVTVAEPRVALSQYKLSLPRSYLGVTQQHQLIITNTSRIRLDFYWTVQQLRQHQCRQLQLLQHKQQQQGKNEVEEESLQQLGSDDAGNCDGLLQFMISPQSGSLQPGQQLQLQLSIEPQRVGRVQLLCNCIVPAMQRLVGLAVAAVVEGLRVDYQVIRPAAAAISSSRGSISRMTAGSIELGSLAGRQQLQHQLVPSNPCELPAAALEAAAAAAAGNPAAAVSWSAGSADRSSAVLAADFGVSGLHQASELLLRVTNYTSNDTEVNAWVCTFPVAAAAAGQDFSRVAGSAAGSGATAVRTAHSQQLQLPPSTTSHGKPTHVSNSGSSGRSKSTSPVPVERQQQLQLQLQLQQKRHTSSAANMKHVGIASRIALNPACVAGPLVAGPFRAAAGNAMIAARQAAAVAAVALGGSSRGCAIDVQPGQGALAGWGSLELRLMAFNNLPGTYVDCLCVKVGDLPVRKVPLRLAVVGSPLVLSKERRVLLQGLQQLAQQQQQQQPSSAAGSSGGDGLTGAQGSSQGSVTCKLALGVLHAGLEHEQSFYVFNTGALSMQLDWSLVPSAVLAADGCNVSSVSSSSTAQPAAPAAAAANAPQGSSDLVAEQLQQQQQQPAAPGRTAAESALSSSGGAAAGRSPSSGAAAAASDKPSSPVARSGNPRTGAAAAGTAAADKRAATTTATPSKGKPWDGKAAGQAEAAAAAAAEAKAAAKAAEVPAQPDAEQEQQEQQNAATGIRTLESAVADLAARPAAASSSDVAGAGGSSSSSSSLANLVPDGGPSCLLSKLQEIAQQRKQQCTASCSSSIPVAAALFTPATDAAAAGEAFVVEPPACLIQPGQQQKFVVRFSSWYCQQHTAVLVGEQSFAVREPQAGTGASEDNDGGDVQQGPLQLRLWPRGSSVAAAAGDGCGAAGAAGPLEVLVSGAFHTAAAPPPEAMPRLQVQLSATVTAARLTIDDPDSLCWSVWSCHDPESHSSYSRTATLTNRSSCPLLCVLRVEGPFELVSVLPSVPQDPRAFRGLKGTSSSMMTTIGGGSPAGSGDSSPAMLLPPAESADVMLRFRPSAAAAAAVSPHQGSSQPGSSTVQQQAAQDVAAAEPTADDEECYSGALLVVAANGQQQRLPLSAIVLRPRVVASPATQLDFGCIHPATPRCLDLLLTNPSLVDATWEVLIVEQPTAADGRAAAAAAAFEVAHASRLAATSKSSSSSSGGGALQAETAATRSLEAAAAASGCFTVVPSSGVISGRGLGAPQSQWLKVSFAPRDNRAHAAVLQCLVRGAAGAGGQGVGCCCSVRLCGQGSFEEADEYLTCLKDM